MPSNDKPVNGQENPSFLDVLNQTPPPPDAKDWPRPKRFAGLRAAWKASWEEGGFLYQRWEEVSQARHGSCPVSLDLAGARPLTCGVTGSTATYWGAATRRREDAWAVRLARLMDHGEGDAA
ncbi:hypothetical protein [Streptomyces griseoruber]|uniref:Uncharacterized protein n=1 Tax=Streptomyces griseoruber TaxID=1943 RepID=A0A101SM91_9ACTN|nr:hypothetical protein [Streptomyces griseoruber]KUN76677.1 hypothetical protein AQJ64_37645 [Streptomyces griseoruber]